MQNWQLGLLIGPSSSVTQKSPPPSLAQSLRPLPSPTQPERIIRGAGRATCQVPRAGDVGRSQALVSVTGMQTTRSGWLSGVCGMGGWCSRVGLELVGKDGEVVSGAITLV